MQEYRHKAHLIRCGASRFNRDTKQWTPRLMVFWNEGSEAVGKSILFNAIHHTEKDAHNHALRFAIKWIDDGKPELPVSTPKRV